MKRLKTKRVFPLEGLRNRAELIPRNALMVGDFFIYKAIGCEYFEDHHFPVWCIVQDRTDGTEAFAEHCDFETYRIHYPKDTPVES
jgi:hypothetical protein